MASRWTLSAALLVATGAMPVEPGCAAGTITLANEHLVVEIDERSASIAAVRRRIDGQSTAVPLVRSEALRLRIPSGDWDGHAAAGSQATRFRSARRSADTVALSTTRFETAAGQFAVDVEVAYRLVDDNLVARLRVRNRGSGVIDGVRFPSIGVEPALDNNETLSMTAGAQRLRDVFSDNRLRVRHDPFERLDPEDLRGWGRDDPTFAIKAYEYPSGFLLHSAWMHYGAGTFGVGIESRDRSFQSQFAVVERKLLRGRVSAAHNRRTYELGWQWVPRIDPGQAWESPEVWIGFDAGDWHGLARQHREWLAGWLERPVVARKFRESLGWVSRGVRDFEQIPALARAAVDAGFPYLLIYGWYGSGMNGLSYDFFPQSTLGGEIALRRNLAEARRLGAYPLAWYNGTTTSEITREHREHGRDWVVVNRNGGLVVDGRWTLFDPDRPPSTEDNAILMNLDMGSPAAAFNIDNVRRMILDYGFSGFEMDQGAKNYASYGGGPGSRSELRYSDGVRDFYVAARDIVKAADPDNIIIAEGYSDFINQYVDSSWTFEGGDIDVPRDTYARYSLPWVTRPAGIFEPDRGLVNRAFMMNAPLDVFLDFGSHPEFVRHLRRLRDLKRVVQRYLYDWDFSDGEGFTLTPAPGSTLMAKSYLGADRRIAVVVINPDERPQSAMLAMSDGVSAVSEYALARPAVERHAGSPIPLQLGAHDVRVYVSEPVAP